MKKLSALLCLLTAIFLLDFTGIAALAEASEIAKRIVIGRNEDSRNLET